VELASLGVSLAAVQHGGGAPFLTLGKRLKEKLVKMSNAVMSATETVLPTK